MAIPVSYNIRNLKLRKGLTVMTALGIALTVTTAVFILALLAGLNRAFVSTGDPLNVLVLRKGSQAELSGGFDAALFPTLKTLPGVAKDSHGEPMASAEWVVAIVLPRRDGTGEVNVIVRGMMQDGLELRPGVKLVEGRWFTAGQREVVVSQSIHKRFAHANVGDTMQFGKGPWTVVGIFDAGGSAYESEIWGTSTRWLPISTDRAASLPPICAPPIPLPPMHSGTASAMISDCGWMACLRPSITPSKPAVARPLNLWAFWWRSSWPLDQASRP